MHFIDREVQLLDDVQHFPADIAGGANDGDAIAHDEIFLLRAWGRKKRLCIWVFRSREATAFHKQGQTSFVEGALLPCWDA